MEERLQKILSRAGYGSRRACEELILAGRVKVNHHVATIGNKADIDIDVITVDGIKISKNKSLIYIILNKPRGVLTTTETPDDRLTVLDLIPINENIYPVGRLDFDSEGLVLLTNDGELTNILTHPRYQHEKEYRLLVNRCPDELQLEKWRKGIVLPDGFRTSPAYVSIEKQVYSGTWLKVILREGHKHQLREMCLAIGLFAKRVVRVRINNIKIGNLKPKEWRYLTASEIACLKKQIPETINKNYY